MRVKPDFTDTTYRQAIIETISAPRFAEYLKDSGGDEFRAVRLYFFNAAISAEFFRYIQLLEVALRNAIHRELSFRYGATWYERHDINLSPQALLVVEKAERILREHGKTPSRGRVVAELPFGFWVKLLGPGRQGRYERSLWRPALFRAFDGARRDVSLPRFSRSEILPPIEALSRFRNRIAHHEPIYRRRLTQDLKSIARVGTWLDSTLGATLAGGTRCLRMLALLSHDQTASTYVVDPAFDNRFAL